MPRLRKRKSISVPIILSSVTVALSIALLIGWIYVILKNISLTQQVTENTLLLTAGIFSFAVIVTVLILFSVSLAREILEVRRQSSFIDSVTHELRSPLASVRLCIETLDREGLGDDQRKRLRGMMLDDVERLTGFIEDILQASRLEHREKRQSYVNQSLAHIVAPVVSQIRQRYRLQERIKVDIPSEICLLTDASALEVVLKNLLDNAVKYSKKDTPIHLRAYKDDEKHLHVDVQDFGIGIPKKEMRRIFDRFYRAPGEKVRAKPGTGLGLFVAEAYVRSLGGKLQAFSEGPGKGTTMRVRLPLGSSTLVDAKAGKKLPLQKGRGQASQES